jgi:glutamate synthase (NADPH/NADH) small chain
MKVALPQDAVEKMGKIVENCMGRSDPFCASACPMNTDVRRYVQLIAQGKTRDALKIIREALFLPGTLGRVCAHPCEIACRRDKEFGRPIAVAKLKRFAADTCDDEDRWDLERAPSTGKKVAIVGAGPAGAQTAVDLARKGHEVVVYDRLKVYGGMMRVGIPEYRLPGHIIDSEYRYLEKLGVRFSMGTEVGRDVPLERLEQDYDAVVIAVGAHKGWKVPVPGHDLPGTFHAVEFLKEISLTRARACALSGKSVIVIGGGDVAMDCARSAFRVGAEEVHAVSLEAGEQIPASLHELEEALAEGVLLRHGYGPVEIIEKEGRVGGVRIQKVVSLFDEQGRFSPRLDPSKEYMIQGDTVIFAVGQKVESDFAGKRFQIKGGGRFVVDRETLQTSVEKVFVAGDACGESAIVVEAMASGRRAARSVDRFLRGRDLREGRNFEREWGHETQLDVPLPEGVEDLPRLTPSMRDPMTRRRSFEECEERFTESLARAEASRCLDCECKLCVKQCLMLQQYSGGCPKDLFSAYLDTGDMDPLIPYSCNMCKQCTLVCPQEFMMQDRFMDLRKAMVKANNGKSPIKGHGAIHWHQRLGFSSLFTMAKEARK